MTSTFQPPHEVTDSAKLESMIAAIRSGQSLPPVVVQGEIAITGSHRIEAYREANRRAAEADYAGEWATADLDIESVECSDDVYHRAEELAGCDLDECGGHNDKCRYLHQAAVELGEGALADALADQIGD